MTAAECQSFICEVHARVVGCVVLCVGARYFSDRDAGRKRAGCTDNGHNAAQSASEVRGILVVLALLFRDGGVCCNDGGVVVREVEVCISLRHT